MTLPIPQQLSRFLLGEHAVHMTNNFSTDIQGPPPRLIWATLVDILKYYKDKPINLKAPNKWPTVALMR